MEPTEAPTNPLETLAAHEADQGNLATTTTARLSSSDHSSAVTSETLNVDATDKGDFLRWRPLYHVQAPHGWMNDPCAPGYDQSTGLYHLFFQWNPKRNTHGAIAWGRICWGHATSKDMTNWSISGDAALIPGSWYDKEGCFTGCMVPALDDDDLGKITLFYTGVSRLPLHYTLPYTATTETLVIAESHDQGEHFVKIHDNPVVPEPPGGLDVTGWRDPYLARWASMDKLLKRKPQSTLYGMISGGIRNESPTAFLYAVDPCNLARWVYLNAIINLGLNHNPTRWSGDMGINWECANFMTLRSEVDGSSREFIIVGAEGSDTTHPNSTFAEHPQPLTKFPRAERSLQWMCGSLRTRERTDGTVVPVMDYVSGGRFDHASMYGVNTFHDPRTGRQIAWGWITEEDLPQKFVDRQNWSGMLSMPRELHLLCIPSVTGTLRSKLEEISSFEIEPSEDGTSVVRTLGMQPAQCMNQLRADAKSLDLQSLEREGLAEQLYLNVQTCHFEFTATFHVSDACLRVGVNIHHSEDWTVGSSTRLYLDVESETISVERPDSSQLDLSILTFAERAPFTLLSTRTSKHQTEREPLEIRAFFDESVLEIFINNRCTFATRVYPSSKRCWGIQFPIEDPSGQSRLVHAQAWDGLRAEMRVSSPSDEG